jgi:Exocyst complex component Sec5
LTRSFGANNDSGRRIVGKVRTGIVGECKKEFETGIFAMLETSIKLAKGSVESPARDTAVEPVRTPSLAALFLTSCFNCGAHANHFQDIRLLLCIGNLSELKSSTIPKIANLFENAFELSFTDNLKGIMEIANTIDEKLFADYTRRRAKVIKEIVKKGILQGIDWATLKQPFGTVPEFLHSISDSPLSFAFVCIDINVL